jgi:hypothetical protein
MGLSQYKLSLIKNGVTIDTDDDGDPIFVPEGSNLYDLMVVLAKPQNLSFNFTEYSHVSVNGVTIRREDLRNKTMNQDVTIELLMKNKGGF